MVKRLESLGKMRGSAEKICVRLPSFLVVVCSHPFRRSSFLSVLVVGFLSVLFGADAVRDALVAGVVLGLLAGVRVVVRFVSSGERLGLVLGRHDVLGLRAVSRLLLRLLGVVRVRLVVRHSFLGWSVFLCEV